MKKAPLAFRFGIAFLALLGAGALWGESVLHAASPNPIWSDDFNAPARSGPDTSRWVHDLGGNGWGNNELQVYTASPDNAAIVDDPAALDGKALVIRALKTKDGGYTSARLKTQGKFSTHYGRVEARLKMPNGQGIWPAFWMLGASISTVGWPNCGEIDVVEVINAHPSKLYGTLHGPGYSGDKSLSSNTTLASGTLDQAYHVYAVEWSPDKIVWSFDGIVYGTQTPLTLPKHSRWVFNDAAFFLLLNVAVGGHWPGPPDATTTFPQTYSIDYVRVYSLDANSPRPQPTASSAAAAAR